MKASKSPNRLLRAASLATLLGVLMCMAPIMLYVWADRNTHYDFGGRMADNLLLWMGLAALLGVLYGGLFGLFIGVVIGIFEMPTPVAVLVGLVAGILALVISAASVQTDGFWGMLAAAAVPAGGFIGFCSNWWANRRHVPRATADDEPQSGSIFHLDDNSPADDAASEKPKLIAEQ